MKRQPHQDPFTSKAFRREIGQSNFTRMRLYREGADSINRATIGDIVIVVVVTVVILLGLLYFL